MGFGASAHLVLQMVRHELPQSRVYVFARSRVQRSFARRLGAHWVGDIDRPPPWNLDAVIDTTPAWRPVLHALAYLHPGGRLVINAIHKDDQDREAMSEIDYTAHLWMEKEIKSVANVTRTDVREFLELAARTNIRPEVEEYTLQDANRAICELKAGKSRGAKVLCVSGEKAEGKIVPIRR
jgi:propanol-preferring alcohol dehydrogenase